MDSTKLFASKRYDHVVLIARRADQLEAEKLAVEEGTDAKVKTFAIDVTDTDALNKALDAADAAFGKPEFVYYNAARVVPSQLLSHDVKEIEYDMKVSSFCAGISRYREGHADPVTRAETWLRSLSRPCILLLNDICHTWLSLQR